MLCLGSRSVETTRFWLPGSGCAKILFYSQTPNMNCWKKRDYKNFLISVVSLSLRIKISEKRRKIIWQFCKSKRNVHDLEIRIRIWMDIVIQFGSRIPIRIKIKRILPMPGLNFSCQKSFVIVLLKKTSIILILLFSVT